MSYNCNIYWSKVRQCTNFLVNDKLQYHVNTDHDFKYQNTVFKYN